MTSKTPAGPLLDDLPFPQRFASEDALEDYLATPSRDLRLLIAIDVVRFFPDRVARRPERYAMPAGKSVAEVKAELDSVLAAARAASGRRRW